MELPAGFVFSPSNENVFRDYLRPLIEGKKDNYLNVIYKTNEIYGDNIHIDRTFEKALKYHRQYVNEHVKDDSLWFFTKVKRLGTSNRFERKAGAGTWTWTISNTGPPIYEDKRESLIGRARSLALTVKVEEDGLQVSIKDPPKRKRVSASETKDVDNSSNWIMHEYFLEKDGKQYTDYVIVKIRRKGNTPPITPSSSCSQEVQNEAAADVRATITPSSCSQEVQNEAAAYVRAAITAQSAYQHQFQPSDYPYEATTAEYNWELQQRSIIDSLMEDQEGSHHDDVPQDVLDSIMAEMMACIDKPVVADDSRAIIGEENADSQDYKEGTYDTKVRESKTPSDYQHETLAPTPTPTHDQSQQGEKNLDFYADTLMEQLLEGSSQDIQQEVILISDSDDEAEPEKRMDEPVATDGYRAVEGDNAASQHRNQEGLSDTLVTDLEAEAVQTQQHIWDEEFSMDSLLSSMQPEKEISNEDFFPSLNFWHRTNLTECIKTT